MEKLVLYIGNKNVSSWSMRPYVALVAKGVPFEERPINFMEDRDRKQRLKIGPTGKVPVLHHGEVVIPDSLAIIEYVEEVFTPPQYPRMWPEDRSERAHARWLAASMHSGFMKLRESMSFHYSFWPKKPKATTEAIEDANEMMKMWDDALSKKKGSGPFLFGPFGAVDAMFAPAVVRLTSFQIAPFSPRVANYMESALSHPAVKKWMDAARALPPVMDY